MEFRIKKPGIDESKYPKENIDLAYRFAKRLYEEAGDLIKSVVLFGSEAKNIDKEKKSNDIDVLVIVDDVTIDFSRELAETYRIIVEKIVADISEKLHITSLKLSSFWGYIRVGDPVGLNILREGISLLDAGFFDPLKALLMRGMIRPSPESVFNYFSRAPMTLSNSKWHILQAVVDLYWAVIDSAHAALMALDVMPPSPEHIGDLLHEKMVVPKLLKPKYVKTADIFYDLYKKITHREIKEISGKEYDRLYKEADKFVKEMLRFINSRGLKIGNV